MNLEHPVRLVVGAIGVAIFGLLYRLATRRSTARDLLYSDLAFFERATAPRRWIGRALTGAWIAGLGLIAIAIARPHVHLPVPVRDGSVFIAIDTSGSMASTDIAPTRAQAANAAARAFIQAAPNGTAIGIIAFAAQAGIVQPLTADRERAVSALTNVPEPNGATAIGDALRLAASALPAHGRRLVVAITDGVNNAGSDPLEAARRLAARHIPIYTIGIGTRSGGTIPGTTDVATIDEDALRAYAAAGGGAYARVEDAAQLRSELARLGRIAGVEVRPVDATIGFALAGATIVALGFLAGLGAGYYR